MIVHVDESPVGTGKTQRALERAAKVPARYLVAVERLDSIDELQQRIHTLVQALSNEPKIISIKSTTAGRGKSVRQDVEALPTQYAAGTHVIAFCTHTALLMSDLRGFAGWHLVIDEVPNVLPIKEVCSKLDEQFFQNHFTLTGVDEKWSKIGLTDTGRQINGSDLEQDDSHRHLRLFHHRVRDSERHSARHVLCNLRDWSEMSQKDLQWTWWSLFSIDELEAFSSIIFLGNGFMKSFTARLLRRWSPDVDWKAYSISGDRKLVSRNVTISYFSDQRVAAKSFFESAKGARALNHIARHIGSNVPKGRFIWSCNGSIAAPLQNHFGSEGSLTPKQAGSDNWMHCTHAAMFYAAKPSSNVRAVLDYLGLDQEDWIASNERETILQFVTRTSIRDVSSNKDAFVYVFSKDQAEYLMRFFESQLHIDAECQFVDLNLDLAREKSGPKTRTLSPEQAEEAATARKKKKADSERRRRAKKKAA